MTLKPRPTRLRPTRLRPGLLGYAALVLAGGGVLTACGHSAPTRFFTLDATPSAAPVASGYAGPPIKVMAVHIPPSLDRTELVSEVAPGRMQVHDFEHWEAPLGLTARQTLVQDLAGRLPAHAVTGPDAPAGPNLAALSAEIVDFRAGPSGATLEASWSLSLPATLAGASQAVWRAPLVQLQAPVSAPDGDGTAQALSALIGQLADHIAADLPGVTERLADEQRVEEARLRAAQTPAKTHMMVRSTSVTTSRPGA